MTRIRSLWLPRPITCTVPKLENCILGSLNTVNSLHCGLFFVQFVNILFWLLYIHTKKKKKDFLLHPHTRLPTPKDKNAFTHECRRERPKGQPSSSPFCLDGMPKVTRGKRVTRSLFNESLSVFLRALLNHSVFFAVTFPFAYGLFSGAPAQSFCDLLTRADGKRTA